MKSLVFLPEGSHRHKKRLTNELTILGNIYMYMHTHIFQGLDVLDNQRRKAPDNLSEVMHKLRYCCLLFVYIFFTSIVHVHVFPSFPPLIFFSKEKGIGDHPFQMTRGFMS